MISDVIVILILIVIQDLTVISEVVCLEKNS